MSDATFLIIIVCWLVTTGIGIALTSSMMWLTHSDLKFLRQQAINGELQRLTALSFWQETRRFCIKVFLFLIGVESLFTHHDPSANPRANAGDWFFIVCLFGVVWLLNYSTIAAMRYRRQFLQSPRHSQEHSDQMQQVIDGIEELHQDNVGTATSLVDADRDLTRNVRNKDEPKGGE